MLTIGFPTTGLKRDRPFSPRQRSKVKYSTPAMFTLHMINAYEEKGFLVMDMCCGDEGNVIGDFTLENLRRGPGEEMDKVRLTDVSPTAL